ncbi:MAG: hypothetical protein J6J60_04840 [Clostridia bacterium]|nr:hypothetical protein [Clostridia bacterium]
MENSAKALYMAGSLLIALVVISLLVAAFNNIGSVQQTKDDIQAQEEVIAFNKEYEAFNKRTMYGVDVISCINKAMNNNERYVKGGRWSESGASGDEALVQVEVRMKDNSLKESIEVYYFEDGKERKYVGKQSLPEEVKSLKWNTLEKDSKPKFTSIGDDATIYDIYVKELQLELKDDFKLLKEENGRSKKAFDTSTTSLYSLVNNIETDIIITNRNKENLKVWSYIRWITCLSDFKKRKFSCVSKDIEYNENNGYINKIVFEEK